MLAGRNFTVIGGGVAGLATSIALAGKEAQVTLLEQSDAFYEVGAGLQITPNGVHVLDSLGLGQVARELGVVPERIELRDYKSGRLVATVDLGKYAGAQEYLLLHRADLIELLAKGAKASNVVIRTGVHVDKIEENRSGVEISRNDGSTEAADFVIGADGLHSVVRGALNDTGNPIFTGQVAWRALVKGKMATNAIQVFMGTKKHIVAYPLRDGSLINIVAVEEREDWVDEGWSHAGDANEMRQRFSEFQGQSGELLGEVSECLVWGLFRHDVARNWHGAQSAIVGDAAHPTLPFLAQGANMALEDAAVLAAKLAAHETGDALSAYQAARRKRVQKIVAAANANARNFHMPPGPARLLAHTGLGIVSRMFPAALTRRYDWIYKFQATAD